jgi:MSHA biogenesis protein MshQ
VAGQTLSGIYVTALNPATGVPTQLSATVATTVGFQFALSCVDPAANAGVQASFTATATALPLCASNGAIPTTWSSSVNLSFPAASPSVSTSYSFSYADVGNVELYLRNSAATSQLGSSGAFVVKPYSLVLTDIKQTATPFTANPVATTATGTRFVRASENFSATVTAVNASCAANLSGYTLLSDIPAACRTPNYGKENAAEGVALSGALLGGLGLTNNPAIANPTAFGAFAGGSATGTTFSWADVGIIKLTPAIGDGSYLGAGSVAGTTTANVGRFYADHFDVVVTTQCGNFTYAGQPGAPVVTGQPFTVDAIARNGSGGTTLNYSAASGFAKSVNLSLAAGGSAGNLYVDAVAGGNGAIPVGVFVAGVGQVAQNAVAGKISYVFNTFPTVLTAIAVHAEDADSATGSAMMAGSNGAASVRAGRLQLSNAYGSELLPLLVPAKIQSWTATGWASNIADSCTVLTVPTNGNAGLSNALSTKTTASLASPVAAGDVRLRLTTPGAGNAGLVDISGSILRGSNTWLSLPAPSARACFGACGPRSPVIYLRESY